MRSELADAVKAGDDTINLTVRHTIELEGSEKPAAVADLITWYVMRWAGVAR